MPTQRSDHTNFGKIKPHGRTPTGQWLIALIGAILFSSVAHAQFNAKCPPDGLSLDQVVRFSAQKIADDRAIAYIQRCQVSFTLDATSLDRLIQAGASSKVLDVISALTASQLTREQAEAQVDGIEKLIAAIGKFTDEERDAALQTFDAAYQVEIRKANQIEPKGPFEPTADYEKRVKDKDAKIAAMITKHDQDRLQIVDYYSNKAHDRAQLYRARIDFLKRATYPESRPLTYTSYNPDTQLLLARIGDDVYGFYHVPPANAESLFKNWKQVRAMQPWTEDGYHTRILTLASPSVTAAGVSMGALQAQKVQDERKKTEAKLAEAQAALDRRDYAGALSQFQAILALDPQLQAARDGIQAAQAALQKRKEEEKNESVQGIWTDPDTGLMWTIRGDDYNVYWKRAEHFCQTLSRAGHADWRLPTIGELESLYDPSPDHERKFRWNFETYHYHMKTQVTLTRTIVWSGTMERVGSKKAWVIDFSDGKKTVSDSFTGLGYEALCVRHPAT